MQNRHQQYFAAFVSRHASSSTSQPSVGVRLEEEIFGALAAGPSRSARIEEVKRPENEAGPSGLNAQLNQSGTSSATRNWMEPREEEMIPVEENELQEEIPATGREEDARERRQGDELEELDIIDPFLEKEQYDDNRILEEAQALLEPIPGPSRETDESQRGPIQEAINERDERRHRRKRRERKEPADVQENGGDPQNGKLGEAPIQRRRERKRPINGPSKLETIKLRNERHKRREEATKNGPIPIKRRTRRKRVNRALEERPEEAEEGHPREEAPNKEERNENGGETEPPSGQEIREPYHWLRTAARLKRRKKQRLTFRTKHLQTRSEPISKSNEKRPVGRPKKILVDEALRRPEGEEEHPREPTGENQEKLPEEVQAVGVKDGGGAGDKMEVDGQPKRKRRRESSNQRERSASSSSEILRRKRKRFQALDPHVKSNEPSCSNWTDDSLELLADMDETSIEIDEDEVIEDQIVREGILAEKSRREAVESAHMIDIFAGPSERTREMESGNGCLGSSTRAFEKSSQALNTPTMEEAASSSSPSSSSSSSQEDLIPGFIEAMLREYADWRRNWRDGILPNYDEMARRVVQVNADVFEARKELLISQVLYDGNLPEISNFLEFMKWRVTRLLPSHLHQGEKERLEELLAIVGEHLKKGVIPTWMLFDERLKKEKLLKYVAREMGGAKIKFYTPELGAFYFELFNLFGSKKFENKEVYREISEEVKMKTGESEMELLRRAEFIRSQKRNKGNLNIPVALSPHLSEEVLDAYLNMLRHQNLDLFDGLRPFYQRGELFRSPVERKEEKRSKPKETRSDDEPPEPTSPRLSSLSAQASSISNPEENSPATNDLVAENRAEEAPSGSSSHQEDDDLAVLGIIRESSMLYRLARQTPDSDSSVLEENKRIKEELAQAKEKIKKLEENLKEHKRTDINNSKIIDGLLEELEGYRLDNQLLDFRRKEDAAASSYSDQQVSSSCSLREVPKTPQFSTESSPAANVTQPAKQNEENKESNSQDSPTPGPSGSK